ncbi:MAG: HD domain-containing phosphohydrolase, partial [Candidatus Omnitrophota bacterium]
DDILHKPGRLDDSERKVIETHPVLGSEIILHIKSLAGIVEGVKYHHERHDGKGYPEKLKANSIPLMAKIIAVADVYDAMISDRPYRKGLPSEVVREEIINNSFRQFDPYVVASFLKAVEKGEIAL